ncbi:TonB-dependent receptor [Niabella ginsengisoli]|uniref:Carboxypeptidase regulatory-like domain-containing protein n=1 Tax=Niabella ginsengisoli TaxID=522298 RepID=A0ABS9SJG4_9BACT|nr:carboxypeptidase regulatory-like domain-containing protein [Niabella ginsengisoli]MCH5598446.1 carboxypeptidase regulatory-like domain-containing protein [Niabella ginsengisoli]
MLKKLLFFIALTIFSTAIVNAQVTTSSASGTVKGLNNEVLLGATVILTHTPTGTVYSAITKSGGSFNIQNLNPGGPYTLEVTNVGYESYKLTDINIPLGEVYQADVNLSNASQELSEVVVSATGRNQRIGAATNISRTEIVNLPNINRSLLDATKLTPQANGGSFLGMSNRFNNITVDGSVFNNNFGLGTNPLPGGASQPISIDAIDQIQVNLAPYDVRQAGFTGAGINAVTRRGTNEIFATVYDYYRNQSFNGKKVDGTDLADALKSSSNIFGASIGGPIIKNKLFFFLNGEIDRRTSPGQSWVPSKTTGDPNPNAVPNVLESDMIRLSDYLKSEYGYDPGSYSGYDFSTRNTKFLARIDWNINEDNRFSIRYNQSETSDDVLINASSGPNPRISNGRRGGSSGGLGFSNSNYKQNNNVYSIVGELNSKFSSSVSNQFLASYTKVHDFRATPGQQFPFVDIMRDANNVLLSFGSELYSYQNYVKNNTVNIADNLTWNLGKHSFLAGASFDYMTFENSFANFGGQSYYRYASLQDFLDNNAPSVFAITYSNEDRTDVQAASANFAQLGFYLQDVFTVNDRLKLTYGARFDLPFYPGDKVSNDSLYAIPLHDPSGNEFRADVGVWPKARLLVSPRVGFTYTAGEDRSWIVRGGTGIFTGRIPFVWLVNQSSDNGVLNTQATYTAPNANMNDYLFNPDRTAHAPATLPPSVGIIPGSYYSVTAPDFKIPQIWRSNLAVDKNLGNGFIATIEGLFSKTINGVYHYNANLGDVKGPRTGFGDDDRNTYNSSYSSKVGQVFVMDNTSKGSSFALTGQLAKRFSKNWQASVAYTYANAKDISPNNGDRSQSSWTQNPIISNPNDPEIGFSAYNVPHRVNAYASYRVEYANKNLATTVSLFYSGASQERYLYRYGGDVNSDGATNDLFFVPESRDGLEQQFTTLTLRNAAGAVTATYTPIEQADAFWSFIENDKQLKNRKGEYVDRYDALLPWVNQLDFRLLQDIAPTIGNKKHTLQISVDIKNLLNMFNNGWGNRYTYNYGSFADQGILGVSSGKYTYNPSTAKPVYSKYYDFASTWNMQLGIRYIF